MYRSSNPPSPGTCPCSPDHLVTLLTFVAAGSLCSPSPHVNSPPGSARSESARNIPDSDTPDGHQIGVDQLRKTVRELQSQLDVKNSSLLQLRKEVDTFIPIHEVAGDDRRKRASPDPDRPTNNER
ncbi:hypothetical protein PsorP6_010732 [Peronosclerospora sorghi]|uniref:Uncharacterized protein n=1 Tax=Peronosclerospora sorghi TaxID=230839 RepID=A0ACC0VWM6_9STRA|nr:hypothetical protein PsorP6_010732 [Peronosclerospora sorghi]